MVLWVCLGFSLSGAGPGFLVFGLVFGCFLSHSRVCLLLRRFYPRSHLEWAFFSPARKQLEAFNEKKTI